MSTANYQVVVIGTGFSGLLCSIYLKEAGVDDFRIFEMNDCVGGVWSHGGVGSYPGAACDVPAYTYLPFLDRTGFIPSKKYVSQTEISSYAELLTDHGDLREHIEFSRKVTRLDYLGQPSATWQVTTVDPETNEVIEVVTCQHVVAANGPLSSPRMPEFPGLEKFKGESFHTARWDRGANWQGKRVGVVGTGASAAQVITAIVDDVEHLTVFQRTPTWALPRNDEPTPPDMTEKFKAGGYGEELRHVDWRGELPPDPEALFTFEDLHDVDKNAHICKAIADGIKHQVKDPELAQALTPDYPFFCKRVLFIDDYYTTFNKSHVSLVADPGGVVEVTETGVKTASGEHHEVDVLIYATGFDSNFIPFEVNGRAGVTLAERFGANESNRFQMVKPHSLWGIHVSDMPNFYMMIGPQSLNPVTNVTLLCEEQAKYITKLVTEMKQNNHTEVEPTLDAVQNWTELCESTADGKVWLRCNNWYMKTTKTDAANGRERSSGMWMDTYAEYLQHVLGGKGGETNTLLHFQ